MALGLPVFIVDVPPPWAAGMCAGKAGAKSTTPDAAEVTGGERPHEETDQDRPQTDESSCSLGVVPSASRARHRSAQVTA